MSPSTGEVTRLLAELKLGNKEALGHLLPLVYRELRGLADHYMRAERVGHTLQATALVHEAYLRLAGQDRADWRNRAQFMGVAAQLMRRILVDYARARLTAKRAGQAKIDLDAMGSGSPERFDEILIVDEALRELGELDSQQARVVEMRYFAGLTVEEAAEALGISTRTVKRDWAMAAAWLRARLAAPPP
jgi:RNA polymerase sigma factor (TIGR02999 family)